MSKGLLWGSFFNGREEVPSLKNVTFPEPIKGFTEKEKHSYPSLQTKKSFLLYIIGLYIF